MKRLLFLGLMTAGILCFAISSVHAYALNDYILNFTAAAAAEGDNSGITDIEHTDEWTFLARSVVGFTDQGIGGDGVVSAGDTFVNYVAVQVTNIIDYNDQSLVFGPDYQGYLATHEITVLMEMTGTQLTDNSYTIDTLDDLKIYFDAGDDFTGTDFTNLDTMFDGTAVESGDLIEGGGVNQDGIITGTLSLILDLQDLLHLDDDSGNEYFELDADGNALPMELVMGMVDSNVNIQENAAILAEFEDYFGLNLDAKEDGGDFDFYFLSRNDGSFNKEVVPEPTTFLLLGIGLIGIASVSRKRHIS